MKLPAPILCLSLLLLFGCGRGGGPERKNLLLVLVDTLRADRLGCYGNERGLSPHIDELAGQGLVFARASSHAPWTLPSTASLLTSLYPRQHGAGGSLSRFTRLDRGVATLAGHLKRAGYATASIVNVAFLGRDFGLNRGFEHVDAQYFESNQRVRRAQPTTKAALAWIDGRDASRPFFLLVHYFDPHAVYDPPQPFRRDFAEPLDREDSGLVFGTREHMLALRAGRLELDPATVRRAAALYDGEVAYTDREVGRLFAGLVQRGLSASTVVAFTSDHGEEFLEHDGFEHGHTLYAELTHVPLILRAPGLAPGRVESGVGHVDVAPTLCELLGIAPDPRWVGRSLLSLASGEGPDRDVLAHGNFWGAPLTGLRHRGEKVILHPDGRAELYLWRDDPSEREDVAALVPERVAALRAHLAVLEQRLEQIHAEQIDLTQERLRELESLGYVESSPGGG